MGKAEILRNGADVLFLAVGSMVYPSYEAALALERQGVQAAVVNVRFVKPLDEEMILRLAQGKKLIVTAEEGCRLGGFGESILDLLESKHSPHAPVHIAAIPDRFVEHGKREVLLDSIGLSAAKMQVLVLEYLKNYRSMETGSLISIR